MPAPLHFRAAAPGDAGHLQQIRRAAFAPIFASFRALLGDELYELVQRREDEAQEGLLATLIAGDPPWTLHVARRGADIVGFVALRADAATRMGEIGLNAVHPQHAGQGVGTAMYEFALSTLRSGGMQVATVSTGGDASHAAARRAYRKAGFEASVPSVWMCCRLLPAGG